MEEIFYTFDEDLRAYINNLIYIDNEQSSSNRQRGKSLR